MQGIKNFVRGLSAAAALTAAAVYAGPAEAIPLKFTVTDGGFSGSWVQEGDPTPPAVVWGSDAFADSLSYRAGNFSDAVMIQFMSNNNPGDYTGRPYAFFYTKQYDSGIYAFYTPIFSGDVSSPHFIQGTYSLYNYAYCCENPTPGLNPTLKIGPAAPAPLAGGSVLAALAALAGLCLTRSTSIARRLSAFRKSVAA